MSQPVEQCCADCGMPISADEAYVCDDCSAFYAIFRGAGWRYNWRRQWLS